MRNMPMTMRIVLSSVVAAFLLIDGSHAILANPSAKRATRLVPDVAFVRPDTSGMEETALMDTAAKMQRVLVPVSDSVHPDGQVGISYVNWPAEGRKRLRLPVVLVHGFDSSCLEYRRLGSKLSARGIDTYAVDLLGWGYTQLDGVSSFSAQAKIDTLNSWVETVLGANTPFAIAGASLGGAAAIEVAAFNPNCRGLILLDAQGFVDGIGPMATLPKPLAKLGTQVLKSVQLRSSANQMSYFDKKQFATDEAVVVGRMHCMREGWSDALVSFMKSGGFSPSAKIAMVQAPSLVLWGRQDTILDGTEFAPKFLETLPNASLQWIEECGHVPHLEQPDVTVSCGLFVLVWNELAITICIPNCADTILFE
jgi:pimeloyl-ACP methyl ester carboxylesterase